MREKLEAAHFELAGVAGGEFANVTIAPREVLIAENDQPVFYTQSLNQIIAWRGVGKTVFALGMAGALTSGGQLLKFKAGRRSKVMYIDGELPLYQMQERVRDLIPEQGRENFYLINAEMSQSKAPIDLGNPKMWDSLRRRLDAFKPDVLILDSRSTLFPSMESNKEDHQGMLQTRFQELRLRKLCVIEAHHLGKNGLQRGHSRNDDALDVQMKLGKPDDWEPGQGLRFVLGYEKVRHSAQLDSDYQVTFNKSRKTFERSDFTVEQLEIARRLDAGQSYQQITKELGASSRTIAKVANKRKKMTPAAGIPY